MSLPVMAFAALSKDKPLVPHTISRRDPGHDDVAIEIDFCGICHSDIHQARDEWGGSAFPMVPGHEIVGRVKAVGSSVKSFKPGDLVGVGCFVDSCRKCSSCSDGVEQYCTGHLSVTYNGTEQDQKTPTHGGYSTHIVVDQNYVLRVPSNLPLAGVAPLLCAGITTYSPMRHWGVKSGSKIAVVGLGGLGHMAVKFGKAFGAEVTVFSTSESKRQDALKLGASHFCISKDPKSFSALRESFDFVLDTVSAPHPVDQYLELLKRDGVMVLVGVPPEAVPIPAFSLIGRRRTLAGSLIGGIKETQEMLDFCGKNQIISEVELIPAQKINDAYERTLRSDVKYRFVLDLKSLKA